MTEIEQFKTGLKDIIFKSIEKCLDCLDLAIDKQANETGNKVRLFKLRLKSLEDRQKLRTITSGDLDVEMNNLILNLMSFIDNDLEEADIANMKVLENNKQKSILIITRLEQEEMMREFFIKHYFPKVTFVINSPTLFIDKADIIIYEDMETDDANLKRIWEYVEKQKDSYFLYFGNGYLKVPKEYNSSVYFTNSPFSLYARLKELLDYIKYYGK
jgi:hypothetical protein